MRKIVSLMLTVLLIAALVPAAYGAEIQLEEIYDTYGLGEEIFICGQSNYPDVSVALMGPDNTYIYVGSYSVVDLMNGIYVGLDRNLSTGEYVLSVRSGADSSIFYIMVVEGRVDHRPSSGNSGSKTQVTSTDVAISETDIEIIMGQSATLKATGEKNSFKWTTDDTDKISISGENSATATITAKKVGTAVVWVYSGNNYATLNVRVVAAPRGTQNNTGISTDPGTGKSEEPVKPEEPKDRFTDLDSVSWAKESINTLAEAGVINGMGGGIFAPDENVTRAQFVQMIVKAFDFKPTGASTFSDVNDEWFAEAVLIAADNGIVNGYDGYFRPNDNITCQDAAVIVHRVLNMKGIELPKPAAAADDDAAEYAKDAIGLLRGNGMIAEEMGFSSLVKASRAQSAYLIYGAYKLK